MAKTVNEAFNEFMRKTVNLDPAVTRDARTSRGFLLRNIANFNNNLEFFALWSAINIHYGSFARRTKCRELDDIDLMVGLSGCGATYNEYDPWNNVRIYINDSVRIQEDCSHDNSTLNSVAVLNKFKNKLSDLPNYKKAGIKRNQEAIVLDLSTKEWSFDIVPCFLTANEPNGKNYYLIPNGRGNWKKTDPRIDNEVVQCIDRRFEGKVVELVRLCKKWNKVKQVTAIPPYLLETIVIDYSRSIGNLNERIGIRFCDVLGYIAGKILSPVSDIKGIQEDINSLNSAERLRLTEKAQKDFNNANQAIITEVRFNDHKKAIRIWSEIFGRDFPDYE
ncbi:MAG: nucleotidyltransferase [Planctomycetia bacterium]|nr:nucleotidyltransferase [Planctomycetia bacterium]